jgi:hypothetical protein
MGFLGGSISRGLKNTKLLKLEKYVPTKGFLLDCFLVTRVPNQCVPFANLLELVA